MVIGPNSTLNLMLYQNRFNVSIARAPVDSMSMRGHHRARLTEHPDHDPHRCGAA